MGSSNKIKDLKVEYVASLRDNELEKLLDGLTNVKRNAGKLKEKLHQLFQDNVADYAKFANWYDESKPIFHVSGKAEYEHYVIENFKKSVYGENYEIKQYKQFFE